VPEFTVISFVVKGAVAPVDNVIVGAGVVVNVPFATGSVAALVFDVVT
jgi:hypothetical protein